MTTLQSARMPQCNPFDGQNSSDRVIAQTMPHPIQVMVG